MLTYIWIGLGSALGGIGRYWCANIISRHFGEALPWGTIVVNVLGSVAIGILAGLVSPDGRALISPDARALLMIGVCGGYTTCLLYTSPSPRDGLLSRMPSSA